MSTDTASIEQAIEQRLQEIDRQLDELKHLTGERERLRGALQSLRQGRPVTVPRRRAHPAAATTSTARRGRPRPGQRAARGSNRTAIVEHVRANPGHTAAQIAAATGIDRSVIYSAVSRLTREGHLRREERDDDQVVYLLGTPDGGDQPD